VAYFIAIGEQYEVVTYHSFLILNYE